MTNLPFTKTAIQHINWTTVFKILTHMNTQTMNTVLYQVLVLYFIALFHPTPCSVQCFHSIFLITAHSYIILLPCFQLCKSVRSLPAPAVLKIRAVQGRSDAQAYLPGCYQGRFPSRGGACNNNSLLWCRGRHTSWHNRSKGADEQGMAITKPMLSKQPYIKQ